MELQCGRGDAARKLLSSIAGVSTDKLPVLDHFRFRFAAHAHYLKVYRKKAENKINDGLILFR